MKKNIWFIIALLSIGFSGGILVGVVVDVDTRYEVIVQKIKQKKSSGNLVLDVTVDTEQPKSKKEIRQAKKEKRKGERKKKKDS